MTIKILITEHMDSSATELLSRIADVTYKPEHHRKPTQLADQIGNFDALIVGDTTDVSESLLANADRLQAIAKLGASAENIDLVACKKSKVKVFLAAGVNAVSVAEYVLTTALVLLRNAYGSTDQLIGGTWPRNSMIGREARGRRIGLIGFGHIGQAVARRARAFAMEVWANDPLLLPESPVWNGAHRKSMDEIIEECDVISLHTPATDSTRRLLGADEFSKMKPGAVLINSASGQLIDEVALVEALRAGHLGGAALDVFENEPLNEVQGRRFMGLSNVILSPHIAGETLDSQREMGESAVRSLKRHFSL